jgi:TatD DNase family protein
MFIDTHCHLNMMVKKNFDTPLTKEHFSLIEGILNKSAKAGISNIINIGTSLQESKNSMDIARRFDSVFTTVGLHPCDCSAQWQEDFGEIKNFVKKKEKNKIVAIGEVGLDFYHKPFNKQRQQDAFKVHIELALEHNLPLVIHVRDAAEELLKLLEEYVKNINKKAVIHCFCHTQDFADTVIEWGFYIGVGAYITYPKNESLRATIKNTPLDKIILETDAPFLPPQQHRGKQNSPEYIPLFAQLIAEQKSMSIDKIASITTVNAQNLFVI